MSGWKPIHSAPRDGSRVLIFVPGDDIDHPRQLVARYLYGYWKLADYEAWHYEPTYWQPLSPDPVSAAPVSALPPIGPGLQWESRQRKPDPDPDRTALVEAYRSLGFAPDGKPL